MTFALCFATMQNDHKNPQEVTDFYCMLCLCVGVGNCQPYPGEIVEFSTRKPGIKAHATTCRAKLSWTTPLIMLLGVAESSLILGLPMPYFFDSVLW